MYRDRLSESMDALLSSVFTLDLRLPFQIIGGPERARTLATALNHAGTIDLRYLQLVSSPGRLPDFIIVGAARCGTTSITRYLRAHPEIFMAQEKELHFFENADRFDLGVDWYKGRFAAADDKQIAGEATPAYMAEPLAVERMAHVVPDARLIAILRNPAERAYSMYWLSKAWGAEGRTAEDALRQAMREPDGTERSRSYMGNYVEQLKHLCRFYPRSSLLTLLFDDFSSAPVPVVRRVCEFIGADPEQVPQSIGRFRNEARRVLSPKLHHIGERIRTRHVGIGERLLLLNSRAVKYPPLSGELRVELITYFKPYNDALSDWLGWDLSGWNR